ncbi:MAG: hypothetical protein V4574_00335 [Pseudomonadota bacterium]
MSLLIAAALAANAAQDAPSGHSLIDTALATILLVCTSAVRDKLDLNDEAALARHGLVPIDDESEAEMRRNRPGIEAALARFPTATILVGRSPGGPCNTLITGDGHAAVRERLVSELTSHNFKSVRRDGPNYQDQVFDFGAAEISVRTMQGANNVAVSVTLKE